MKVHVKAILRKIRVQNRTQAAIWAMNHGALARAELSNAPSSGRDIDRRMPSGRSLQVNGCLLPQGRLAAR